MQEFFKNLFRLFISLFQSNSLNSFYEGSCKQSHILSKIKFNVGVMYLPKLKFENIQTITKLNAFSFYLLYSIYLSITALQGRKHLLIQLCADLRIMVPRYILEDTFTNVLYHLSSSSWQSFLYQSLATVTQDHTLQRESVFVMSVVCILHAVCCELLCLYIHTIPFFKYNTFKNHLSMVSKQFNAIRCN